MSPEKPIHAAESPPKGAAMLVYTQGIDLKPLNHMVPANSADPLAYAWRTQMTLGVTGLI